jgi:SAM-dependent methyltransferase
MRDDAAAPTGAPPPAPYDDGFYREQMEGSYRSARRYVAFVMQLLRPRRVVDVGCGRGTWLKAFRDHGADECTGFDGPWNSQANMVDGRIAFTPVDLNRPIPLAGDRYDLALSLEVAEHLEPGSAPGFVESLTRLADVVMFAAAFTGQGGIHHVNERPHTYWAGLFAQHGYLPYDLFRPAFWGDPEVQFWYQQNTFLYVRRGGALEETLARAGHRPLQNVAFMDCIHPALYEAHRQQVGLAPALRRAVGRAIPPSLVPLMRRIRRTGS